MSIGNCEEPNDDDLRSHMGIIISMYDAKMMADYIPAWMYNELLSAAETWTDRVEGVL